MKDILEKPRQTASAMAGMDGTVESQRTADLARILEGNPILDAYLLNYLANSYVGPLLKIVESQAGLTRPEWIVVFCLSQHEGLNAQQISDVTGRAKSSISHAIKLLEKKNFLRRMPDLIDGRRQVLRLTGDGQKAYQGIIGYFQDRERKMLACLDATEKSVFRDLMFKLAGNVERWGRSDQ
tara:strand:- start:14952 stop:15497 length:546 start_codon:yes stop_codon:yes gene_type:complete